MDLNAVEQLKNVLSSMSSEKDQIIYEEGEPTGDGYILSIGKVRLFTAKALEKSSALIIPKATFDKKLSTLDPFLRLLFRQAPANCEHFE